MKKIKILLLTLTVLSLSSCKDYLDINQDPSNPQVAEGYVLLPPIMQSMVRGEVFDSRFIGQYVQNGIDTGIYQQAMTLQVRNGDSTILH
jgi:hypothetical protein